MMLTNELFRRKLCQYRSLGCPRDALSVESKWHTVSVLVHTGWLILIRHTAMLRQSRVNAQLHDRFAGFLCLSDRMFWEVNDPSFITHLNRNAGKPRQQDAMAKGQIWTRKSSCFECLAHPSILIFLMTSFPSCTRCMTFMKQSILTCRTHSDPYPQAQGWQAGKADFFQARPWKLVMNMNVLNGIWIIKRVEIRSVKSYHHKSQFGLTRCPDHESWDHPEFSL